MLLSSKPKKESYYNVFGQWVESPFDESLDNLNLNSPAHRYVRSVSPYYWYYPHGKPFIPGYYRWWRWW